MAGNKIYRLRSPAERTRNNSLSFLIPVSRIKMTISRRSSRVRGRQLLASGSACVNNFETHDPGIY